MLSQEGCKVAKVDASLRGDTVVHVVTSLPAGFRDTLAKMPLAAKVTEEPSPAESHGPKRLRLLLKSM